MELLNLVAQADGRIAVLGWPASETPGDTPMGLD
jgi:hypothetical protein